MQSHPSFILRNKLRIVWLGYSSLIGLLLTLLTLQPVTNVQAALVQEGAVDPTFKSGSGFNEPVDVITLQNDGKILVGGDFTHYTDKAANYLTRLNADGSADSSFNPGNGPNSTVNAITYLNDGKILIGGNFGTYNGIQRPFLARLHPDGSLDTSFDSGSSPNGPIKTIAQQSDGKILIGGEFNYYPNSMHKGIVRLNANGSLDPTFNPGNSGANNSGLDGTVSKIIIRNDGKILIVGHFWVYNSVSRGGIARLNADGSLDTSFNPGSGAYKGVDSLVVQADGKLVIAGEFDAFSGVFHKYITRLNADGSPDTSFNPGTGPGSPVKSVALQSNGKILLIGGFSSYNSTQARFITRLNSDGSLDSSFKSGTTTNLVINALAIQANNNILIGGFFTSYNNTGANHIAQLQADGLLNTSFSSGTGADTRVGATVVQDDGKILIAGRFTTYNGAAVGAIARLNSDGSLDTSFNAGKVGADNYILSLTLQNDGKIMITGAFSRYNGTIRAGIARLNSDGSLDTTFNAFTDQQVYAVVQQSDNKLIIGGTFSKVNNIPSRAIARLNPDGSLDSSFNPGSGSDGYILALALQANGKILVGGNFATYNDTASKNIARVNSDGSLDSSFNPGSGLTGQFGVVSYAGTIVLQNDGRILVGGSFTSYNNVARRFIVRINSDGSLDTSFNPESSTDGHVSAIVVQADGKILIGGRFTSYAGVLRYALARIMSDGALDNSFTSPLKLYYPLFTIAQQKDGKVIIGGDFTLAGDYVRDYVARLEATVVNKQPSSLSLTSSANPVLVGQEVTFIAKVSPAQATGTVTFDFGSSLPAVVVAINNGQANYTTGQLSAGTHIVKATYSGDAAYTPGSSAEYTQLGITGCDPLVVTSSSDDGQATNCGTFSYALANTISGKITFNLPEGNNTISLSNELTPSLKSGVTLDGGVSGIILDGKGASGNGLRLNGDNMLLNLTVRGFSGQELVVTAGSNPNRFYRVRVEK